MSQPVNFTSKTGKPDKRVQGVAVVSTFSGGPVKLGVKPKPVPTTIAILPKSATKPGKINHKPTTTSWAPQKPLGPKPKTAAQLAAEANKIKPVKAPVAPAYDRLYITLRSPFEGLQISVLAGDEPPQITGGYAKWQVVDRPLRRGISVFQGYDPATMTVPLRFGMWRSQDFGVVDDARPDHPFKFLGLTWNTSDAAGQQVERNIRVLEQMAGATQTAGQPPYVYVNSYDAQGRSTALVPPTYQTMAGAPAGLSDTRLWPWVITDVSWGRSLRSANGWRIYQECTVTLMNYLNYNRPPTKQQKGGYFKTTHAVHTRLRIAGSKSVHSLNVGQVAELIRQSPKNNPIAGHSKIHLKDHGTNWNIPVGREIWVPSHTV